MAQYHRTGSSGVVITRFQSMQKSRGICIRREKFQAASLDSNIPPSEEMNGHHSQSIDQGGTPSKNAPVHTRILSIAGNDRFCLFS